MRKGMNALNDQLAQQQQQQGGQQGERRTRARTLAHGAQRRRSARARRRPADDEYGEEDYDNGSGYGKRTGSKATSPKGRAKSSQELRRRLGDTSRAQDELDYIERLLKAP